MTTNDLVASLNQSAAGLLAFAQCHPTRVHDMRSLAVRLQIMAMRLGEMPPAEAPTPELRLVG